MGERLARNSARLVFTRRRYDRLAPFYDLLEAPIEIIRFAAWRARLRHRISGKQALEVGVGTGKNFIHYPPDMQMTAVDISHRMLMRAQLRAGRMGVKVKLLEMDVQDLAFPDNFFDTVFATFVFCSVPDPVSGLQELKRVCRQEGRLLLLEHMRPETPIRGFIFDRLNPLVVHMMGANINRRTMDNVRRAGWRIQVEERLSSDIVRWIECSP